MTLLKEIEDGAKRIDTMTNTELDLYADKVVKVLLRNFTKEE